MQNPTHSPTCILVTGGAGFIGTNLVRHLLLSDAKCRVVNLDLMTYAGSHAGLDEFLAEKWQSRYRFVQGDIADAGLVGKLFDDEHFDTVVHLAAESHVDRSITGPAAFITTNINGTFVLLEAARAAWDGKTGVRFHHVSTDEVYGSLGETGFFTEMTPYDPSSPYSASKAASDHLVRAWHRTFNLPVTISNCSNNYGPYQHKEKLIPHMIDNALNGLPLPVYGDGKNVRDWLYVEDHCQAVDRILRYGQNGQSYNIGGCNEWKNIDIVTLICELLQEYRPMQTGHYRDLINFVTDRPGHDRRYAIDASKLKDQLDWQPQQSFESGLRKTVEWYLAH